MNKITIVSLQNTENLAQLSQRNGSIFSSLYSSEDSYKSFDDHSSTFSNEDEDDITLEENPNENGLDKKEVKKRQRLTHLSNEEKIMRRKLKNRMAAQSARDRKKLKMEELEQDLIELKAQNEKLKNENTLLKEHSKALIEENRKLLKLKSEHLNQREEVKMLQIAENKEPSLKRKIDSLTLVGAADESAEETTASINASKVYLHSNLVHNQFAKQRNRIVESEKKENGFNDRGTRCKKSAFSFDEDIKVKNNFIESNKAVKILPAADEQRVSCKSNSVNQKQSNFENVSQIINTKLDDQFGCMQTNDVCLFNDETYPKQIVNGSFYDENLLEFLQANIESDKKTSINLTTINDKIDFSIQQLEDSVKNDSQLPSLHQLTAQLSNQEDLTNELDFDSLNLIMNSYINSLCTENTIDLEGIDSFSSHSDFGIIDTDILVQNIDPMISNGVFDIKLI